MNIRYTKPNKNNDVWTSEIQHHMKHNDFWTSDVKKHIKNLWFMNIRYIQNHMKKWFLNIRCKNHIKDNEFRTSDIKNNVKYIDCWTSDIKNHLKNNDFWFNLPNRIDFKFYHFFRKMFLVIFGNFSLLSYFLTLPYQSSYSNGSFPFNKKFWKPFFASKLQFSLFIFIMYFFNFVVFRTYVTQF